MKKNRTHILLFDGICNLCNGAVKFIIKRDPKGKFKFAALQSEIGQTLLKKQGLSGNDFDSVVLVIDEKYYTNSAAALMVLKELDGFWSLTYVLIYLPKSFRDFVYKLIARNRYKIFGKKSTCMVPSNDIKQRFL